MDGDTPAGGTWNFDNATCKPAPLNAVEGVIRQIIGRREFIRGVYFVEGPDYMARDALGHVRPLPALFWGGETRMRCLGAVVGPTREHAYATVSSG